MPIHYPGFGKPSFPNNLELNSEAGIYVAALVPDGNGGFQNLWVRFDVELATLEGNKQDNINFINGLALDIVSVANMAEHTMDITFNILPDAIDHNLLDNTGLNTHTQIDTHLADLNNPHAVSPSQVGNTTAQWNANSLEGQPIADTVPMDGQALIFDTINGWQPESIVEKIMNAGINALTLGTVTIADTGVTVNSIILTTAQNGGLLGGVLRVSAKVVGVSFTISSSSILDTANIGWIRIEP